LYGRERGHSSPRASNRHFSRPERWLLHGRHGRHRPSGSLLERALFSPRFAQGHPCHIYELDRGHQLLYPPALRPALHQFQRRFEVAEAADQIGSTEGIITAIQASPAGTEWAVGTEIHLVNRLSKELQNHKVISLDSSVCVCTTMFRITPQHLLWVLEILGEGNVVNRISVDERTRHHARAALDRMLSLR